MADTVDNLYQNHETADLCYSLVILVSIFASVTGIRILEMKCVPPCGSLIPS